VPKGLMGAHQEQPLQHFDYVIVGVMIVVQQHDVILRSQFVLLLVFELWKWQVPSHTWVGIAVPSGLEVRNDIRRLCSYYACLMTR
jgi:hypothetical protein